jgi:hypothetical protein
MQSRLIRFSAMLLAVLVIVGTCLVDVGAQTRRKRRTRRARVTKPVVRPVVTNPDIALPGAESTGPDGEKIISTADQTATETEPDETPTKKTSGTAKTPSDADIKQTINALSTQVDRLNDKLSQMQDTERTRLDMERLTRAEQRAESLRVQQVDVESKLADLQSKLEQIEFMLKPENIERAAGFGTVHPEEARESRRRQLENERRRVQAQINILETSRTRLETAVRTADAEVDSLRRKIEMQQAQQDTSGVTTSEPPARRRPE